jgi:dihydrofolate reductase
MHTEVGAQMLAADTMLLGRNTYEEFGGHWATQGSDVPFADQINGIPKLVASRTLTDVTWQNSCLRRRRGHRAASTEKRSGQEHRDLG